MNIIVYGGADVDQASLRVILLGLKGITQDNYDIQTVSTEVFLSNVWQTQSDAIRKFVENGGSFLGFALRSSLSTPNSRSTIHFKRDDPTRDVAFQMDCEVTQGGGEMVSISTEGGPGFQVFTPISHTFSHGTDTPLATYDDRLKDLSASIVFHSGRGTVVVWGISMEDPSRNLAEAPKVLELSLKSLGLSVATAKAYHPSPQFFCANSGNDLESLSEYAGDESIVQDVEDVFHFHPFQDDPLRHIDSSNFTNDPKTWTPTHIILCQPGTCPPPTLTPSFNIVVFYQTLDSLRDAHGKGNIGGYLLYGEVVTSTQSQLEKNPRFASFIPSPLVSVAAHQLRGRGRSTNVWLSSPGCLQFSLLLRVPLRDIPANKLVFIQYLMSLAVSEACHDPMILGAQAKYIQLKWPNDIYAVTASGQKHKVGGVLVNTSFMDGVTTVIIGCGINYATERPLFSLSGLPRESSQTPITAERLLATTLTKFEGIWEAFKTENGSFATFMPLYLSRWMHSDQLITLAHDSGVQRVRICGITPDHGFLRALPENGLGEAAFIDLRPDGNTFDIFEGLIRAK